MNGKYLILYRIRLLALLLIISGSVKEGLGQRIDSLQVIEPVKVIANISADSVMLRWAPESFELWQDANKLGYVLERYTMARNGKVLPLPEKTILTNTPLKPYTEEGWQRIIETNKYVAVAAQALIGETFELDMEQSDAFQLISKTKENEQRFSIALYCADMSILAAKALGLQFTDTNVKKDEKYLYRIICNGTEKGPFRGSIFIDMDEPSDLPAPMDFTAEANGAAVMLRWNVSYQKNIYIGYIIEKSQDGKNFTPISEDPAIMLNETTKESPYAYSTDTLTDITKEYAYRIKGLSPFGKTGPPSEVIKVQSIPQVNATPFIKSAESPDNATIMIEWEFPDELAHSVKGFNVERAATASGNYQKVNSALLEAAARSYNDKAPSFNNYYRVIALSFDDKEIRSMPFYIHLVDSIPPSAPQSLEASIDDRGIVKLSWNQNTEPDIYGYRIYRAYYQSDEFAQITHEPVRQTEFTDTVQLQSLNEKIHYQIMAIDINQNHSVLSPVLSVALPDKVPPVSPVFLPVKSTPEGVELSWIPSSSTDVTQYDVYRKGDQDHWIRIAVIPSGQDSVYHYTDKNLSSNKVQVYTITAVDEAALESPPATPVSGSKINTGLDKPVQLEEPIIDRANRKVTIRWPNSESDISSFQIYKAVNDNPLTLYRTVKTNEFTDPMLRIGDAYSYRILAILKDGSRSELSEEVKFIF